jgi:hypothetical protein
MSGLVGKWQDPSRASGLARSGTLPAAASSQLNPTNLHPGNSSAAKPLACSTALRLGSTSKTRQAPSALVRNVDNPS